MLKIDPTCPFILRLVAMMEPGGVFNENTYECGLFVNPSPVGTPLYPLTVLVSEELNEDRYIQITLPALSVAELEPEVPYYVFLYTTTPDETRSPVFREELQVEDYQ